MLMHWSPAVFLAIRLELFLSESYFSFLCSIFVFLLLFLLQRHMFRFVDLLNLELKKKKPHPDIVSAVSSSGEEDIHPVNLRSAVSVCWVTWSLLGQPILSPGKVQQKNQTVSWSAVILSTNKTGRRSRADAEWLSINFRAYFWRFLFVCLFGCPGSLLHSGSLVLVAARSIFRGRMRGLVPWPGIQPRPLALVVWSLRHWTKEVPGDFLSDKSFSWWSYVGEIL